RSAPNVSDAVHGHTTSHEQFSKYRPSTLQATVAPLLARDRSSSLRTVPVKRQSSRRQLEARHVASNGRLPQVSVSHVEREGGRSHSRYPYRLPGGNVHERTATVCPGAFRTRE